MTPNSHTSFAYAWLAVLASVGTAGCLCPPCPGAVAAGPAAAAQAPAGANVAPAAPAAPAATGSRLVIWDGDGAGSGAQGWDSCDQKATCKVKAGADSGSGTNGSTALKLHGEGPGFIGMGWNLFGWYPENAGVDMTPYSHLTFQIRVEAKSAEAAPDPGSVGVLLGCSRNKNNSATVPLERYAKGFQDGKWHKVDLPISAFTKGSGANFDLQSFWEFRLATWSGTARNFDIYIDDITLEKQ
jgi:hypothetical protein